MGKVKAAPIGSRADTGGAVLVRAEMPALEPRGAAADSREAWAALAARHREAASPTRRDPV